MISKEREDLFKKTVWTGIKFAIIMTVIGIILGVSTGFIRSIEVPMRTSETSSDFRGETSLDMEQAVQRTITSVRSLWTIVWVVYAVIFASGVYRIISVTVRKIESEDSLNIGADNAKELE
jgi:hypothetical protein